MAKRKAIVLDLDGTLLNSRKEVSARDVATVRTCLGLGHLVVIATARPLRKAMGFLPTDLQQCHLVLCNGAWTVKDEAIIHRNEIPCGRVWQIVDELTARGMRPAIEAGDCFYTDPERPADNRRDYVPIGSYPGIDACKVLARVPGGVDRQAVAAFLPDGLDCVVTDGGTLLQVSSVTCSKATACSTLFDAEGVDLADTYAFGDDYNDIPLFSKVGTAIAMGNAPAEVRQAAHLVTSSNDEDGVSEGIETHVLASPRAEGA